MAPSSLHFRRSLVASPLLRLAATDGSKFLRRRRAPQSSDTLLAKVKDLQSQGLWSEETMLFSAVEETAEATTTDDIVTFPLAGKRIEDVCS